MVGLLARARAGSSQPELYAALVQACRFCGLLEASVAAHERAEQLDRNILTSVDHTWWHLRDYDRALEYVQRRRYGEVSITNRTMRAGILSELGRKDEAIREYREVEQARLTEFFRDLVLHVPGGDRGPAGREPRGGRAPAGQAAGRRDALADRQGVRPLR